MIVGIGNDIVDINRIKKVIERHGDRFLMRCFTEQERKQAEAKRSSGGHIAVYARRWAAKEAGAKALGTGFINGIFMKDIYTVNDSKGRPFIEFTGGAHARLSSLIPEGAYPETHVSLSDDANLAQAFVIIEAG